MWRHLPVVDKKVQVRMAGQNKSGPTLILPAASVCGAVGPRHGPSSGQAAAHRSRESGEPSNAPGRHREVENGGSEDRRSPVSERVTAATLDLFDAHYLILINMLAPPLQPLVCTYHPTCYAFSETTLGQRLLLSPAVWYTTGCPALSGRLSSAAAVPCARAQRPQNRFP